MRGTGGRSGRETFGLVLPRVGAGKTRCIIAYPLPEGNHYLLKSAQSDFRNRQKYDAPWRASPEEGTGAVGIAFPGIKGQLFDFMSVFCQVKTEGVGGMGNASVVIGWKMDPYGPAVPAWECGGGPGGGTFFLCRSQYGPVGRKPLP